MNKSRSNNPFVYLTSLALLLASLLPVPATAEVPLRSFTADYDLFSNGMHIATSKLKLSRAEGAWRWLTEVRARGIYALFINKKPYSETTFIQDQNGLQLQQVVVADRESDSKYESAKFDWQQKRIQVLRKGEQKILELLDTVYDYQSIHVLAADMHLRQQKTATVDFYRKGKLMKSFIQFSGPGTVKINGESVEAHIFDHTIVRSDSKLRYYYAADNPMLPLRIEKLEAGEGPTVLTLKKVDLGL